VDNVRQRADYIFFVGIIKRHKCVFSRLITSFLKNMKVVLRDKVMVARVMNHGAAAVLQKQRLSRYLETEVPELMLYERRLHGE